MKRTVILLAALACSGAEAPASDVEIDYGERFNLPVGNLALVGGTSRVTFTRLAEESRCPSGTTCIQAGNAAAVFAVESPVGDATLTLNTDREPRRAAAAGLALDLIELEPRPAGGAVDSAAYVATLVAEAAP